MKQILLLSACQILCSLGYVAAQTVPTKDPKVAEQEELVKNIYKEAKKEKPNRKKALLKHRFFTLTAAYGRYTNTEESPFRRAVYISPAFSLPLAHGKWVFTLAGEYGISYDANINWFAKASKSNPLLVLPDNGRNYALKISYGYTMHRTQGSALIIGPEVGIKTTSLTMNEGYFVQETLSALFLQPSYGAKLSWLLGYRFCVNASYQQGVKRTFHNTTLTDDISTPINTNLAAIGIGVLF